MEQFLELYGFLGVVLHAAGLVARSVAAGSAVFLALIAAPLARDAGGADGARLVAQARGAVLVAAGAALVAVIVGAALQAVALAATLQAPIAVALGAGFMWVAAGEASALLAIAALAAPRARPEPWRRAALCGAALAAAALAVGQSHAAARTDDRTTMFVATFLHQAGAALWLGGLPPLLLALRLPAALARRAGRLYSRQAAAGVALIGVGILGFWSGYLGGTEAVYGTAYGAMAAAKGAMLAALLLLGAGNFVLLHGFGAPGDGPPSPRIRRFVECEIAIGIAVLAAAASLTSLPPAVDLPAGDRASWAEVVERWTPRAPRLTSPDQSDLAIPALQSRLDAGWRSAQGTSRPRAFNPGEGELPPRNAEDIAWSEYNHNWAGLAVLAVGLAALLDAGRRVPGVRHWPLLFLGLAGFILVRADPEAWPLGAIGFWESLRDSTVVQHKLAGLLVVAFALSEWGVRLGRLGGRVRYVFPVAMLAGGLLLLLHSHSFADPKEGLLVELAHLPIGVLAVFAGCSRWLELRGPDALSRPARWVWPVCLVLVGALLTVYREA